jgi:hypothetical protein
MVGDNAPIQRDDGHVTDQKAELPRTSRALFSDPFVSACTIETGGRGHLVTDAQSTARMMETAGECGRSGERCHEYE